MPCEVVICSIVALRILFHINAVAKLTAFAAKVINNFHVQTRLCPAPFFLTTEIATFT